MGISENDVLLAKSTKVVSSGSSPRSEWKSSVGSDDRRGGQPKYKQRRVLGLREYPPGCGPQIDSIPGKFEVSSVDGTDSAGLEKENSDVGGIGTMRDQSHYPPGYGPQFEVSSVNEEDSAGLEKENSDVDGIGATRIQSHHVLDVKYPPKRRVAGVRDFPPNCGRNAKPLISKGEEQEKEPMMNAEFGSGVPERRSCKVAARKNVVKISLRNYGGLKVDAEKGAALDLESSSSCSLTKGTVASVSKKVPVNGSERSNNRSDVSVREQRKPLAKNKATSTTARYNFVPTGKTDESVNQGAEWNGLGGDKCNDSLAARRRIDSSMNLVPSGPSSSIGFDIERKKVRELLREFHKICRKSEHIRRVDCFAAGELKKRNMCLNEGESIVGAFPGVEVGDEFLYRLEFHIIGFHRPPVNGIDFVKQGNITIAVSVVASGGYDDDLDDSDFLEYTGQGGRPTRTKEAEDQKLEAGNLALKNSIEAKNPVRVIRGDEKMSADVKGRVYVYDGLYTVERYWQEQGPNGKLVFKFHMVRIPGQPELAWKQVRRSKKAKVREGLCMTDISQGKEVTPICVVNTVDDEKPLPFKYITRMIYPDHPAPSNGCGCRNGCSSGGCSCIAKNGGEFPYNRSGALIEVKDLVYECGPSCKCPPSCYNRVSQKGIKLQLEVFKTSSRGWGVRSLNSIPSGSFICEYIGELLEDNEAERRKNDEYLFDIGRRRDNGEGDGDLLASFPDAHSSHHQAVEESNFTIDAAEFGNIGRFINHSCSPNLYAQNVLYDHGNPKIPHIMLFALENIPPLRELTYDYNYQLDQVHDSNGNIKRKICYCGSAECRGRLY
ncbi:Histone-lysine N-methyltransferase, H3 lysine-9 specific SUVH5 [Linum perenne]